MKYVLDSNVFKYISSQERRNDNVDAWLKTVNDRDVYITVMTVLESQKGIEKLKRSKNQDRASIAQQLESNLQQYLDKHGERVLPLDTAAAREWGRRLVSQGTKDASDLAIISIVATQAPAVAVTDNREDFVRRGVKVIIPFKKPAEEIDPE